MDCRGAKRDAMTPVWFDSTILVGIMQVSLKGRNDDGMKYRSGLEKSNESGSGL
jgi:hypothetical protein